MRKCIIAWFVAVFVLLVSASAAMAAARVVLNGQELAFDVPPVIEKGRTLVPLRVIFEALGVNVNWDDRTRTVTAAKGGTEIKLVIGGRAYKNNQPVALDVPAKIVKGRTLVPLRFVSEALGAFVFWDGATQTVTIYSSVVQPDEAVYKSYFAELGLGKLPVGGQLPQDLQRGVRVFAPGDQVCLYGTIVREVTVSYEIYDLKNNKPSGQKGGFPRPLSPGGFAGAERLDLPPGDYAYIVYVGDVPVAVFPFQVR